MGEAEHPSQRAVPVPLRRGRAGRLGASDRRSGTRGQGGPRADEQLLWKLRHYQRDPAGGAAPAVPGLTSPSAARKVLSAGIADMRAYVRYRRTSRADTGADVLFGATRRSAISACRISATIEDLAASWFGTPSAIQTLAPRIRVLCEPGGRHSSRHERPHRASAPTGSQAGGGAPSRLPRRPRSGAGGARGRTRSERRTSLAPCRP